MHCMQWWWLCCPHHSTVVVTVVHFTVQCTLLCVVVKVVWFSFTARLHYTHTYTHTHTHLHTHTHTAVLCITTPYISANTTRINIIYIHIYISPAPTPVISGCAISPLYLGCFGHYWPRRKNIFNSASFHFIFYYLTVALSAVTLCRAVSPALS